jgi:HK97 family phage major capsid protein
MEINLQELNLLYREFTSLSNKVRMTKEDEKRCAYLQTAISAVKAGASLSAVDESFHNARSVAAGLPTISLKRKPLTEEEQRATAWQHLVENRAMGEGAPMLNHIGVYTGLGYFIPNSFFETLFRAMSASDAILNEDVCTLIKSTDGRPISIPLGGDISNTAQVVNESGSQSVVDFASTGQAVLGSFSYCSDRYVVSQESMMDLSTAVSVSALAQEFFADKLRRGIARDLIVGNGISKPLGLIPALEALGVPTITATGSAGSTGGAETGSTSLGLQDFSSAYAQLDEAYIGPKTGWGMSHKTLANLLGLVNKFGDRVNIVEFIDGKPTILGLPIFIMPSMDSIGPSKYPVVLGNFGYWASRLITADEGIGLKTYFNSPGLAENGNVGLRCFARASGALLYSDTISPSPFILIRNFS